MKLLIHLSVYIFVSNKTVMLSRFENCSAFHSQTKWFIAVAWRRRQWNTDQRHCCWLGLWWRKLWRHFWPSKGFHLQAHGQESQVRMIYWGFPLKHLRSFCQITLFPTLSSDCMLTIWFLIDTGNVTQWLNAFNTTGWRYSDLTTELLDDVVFMVSFLFACLLIKRLTYF